MHGSVGVAAGQSVGVTVREGGVSIAEVGVDLTEGVRTGEWVYVATAVGVGGWSR